MSQGKLKRDAAAGAKAIQVAIQGEKVNLEQVLN